MLYQNPYQVTATAEPVPRADTATTNALLWWTVFCYPVVMLAAVFGSWGLTYLSLGRPPGHGEYPGDEVLHAIVHVMGYLAAICYLGGPAIVPVGMLWSVTQPFARSWSQDRMIVSRVVCLGTYVLMLVTVGYCFVNESLGIMDWFWD